MPILLKRDKESLRIHNCAAYTKLDKETVLISAKRFASYIESNIDKIVPILTSYETFEVAIDEIERTLDLLNNLDENSQYFQYRVDSITTFLPRNQPLYALMCFVVIPSYLAEEVHFRIPFSMRELMPNLLTALDFKKNFNNIFVSNLKRNDFLKERAAIKFDPISKKTRPVSDVVIFTGTPQHASHLTKIFDKRTLFIANGAGHNPVVISESANINEAVEAVLKLQLYNQGQDCAAPNSILVHSKIYSEFHELLLEQIGNVCVGKYEDKKVRVGPLTNTKDLETVQKILCENSEYLDPRTPGLICTKRKLVQPTIIARKLEEGGNFRETFAPLIFLQEYKTDASLKKYFEDKQYSPNAMYLTLYGSSNYVESLVDRKVGKTVLHPASTFIHNTHLHAKGIESGVKPYGGFGKFASSLSINGVTRSIPTLPQRDIYTEIVEPLLKDNKMNILRETYTNFSEIISSHVHNKLIQSAQYTSSSQSPLSYDENEHYVDTSRIGSQKNKRYAKIGKKFTYSLLESVNHKYISTLAKEDFAMIRNVRSLLLASGDLPRDDFAGELYAIASNHLGRLSELDTKSKQQLLFGHIYQLLFGLDHGPRLFQFLADVEKEKVCELLDV